jgi:acetyl-CoA synthetase
VSDWAERTLGVRVRDQYGQTELGMAVANAHHPDLIRDQKPGSMGCPLPGWSVAVLQEKSDDPAAPGELGRLAVNGPESPAMFFTGYHDAPDRTVERFSEDGRWYYTGDAGFVDSDGAYFFSARDDDVLSMRSGTGIVHRHSLCGTQSRTAHNRHYALPDAARARPSTGPCRIPRWRSP